MERTSRSSWPFIKSAAEAGPTWRGIMLVTRCMHHWFPSLFSQYGREGLLRNLLRVQKMCLRTASAGTQPQNPMAAAAIVARFPRAPALPKAFRFWTSFRELPPRAPIYWTGWPPLWSISHWLLLVFESRTQRTLFPSFTAAVPHTEVVWK